MPSKVTVPLFIGSIFRIYRLWAVCLCFLLLCKFFAVRKTIIFLILSFVFCHYCLIGGRKVAVLIKHVLIGTGFASSPIATVKR